MNNAVMSAALFSFFVATDVRAQTLLEADGIVDASALIEGTLGPYPASETPDCAHPEFGPHTTQTGDDALGKYVISWESIYTNTPTTSVANTLLDTGAGDAVRRKAKRQKL